MISFIRKGILIIMACVGGIIGGCESKKVPLNKEQFTNLLIDLHRRNLVGVPGNRAGIQ